LPPVFTAGNDDVSLVPVRFTDVDYDVFTDAARAVAAGGSPYARATYRYPPAYAWLLAPGALLHAEDAWGKALFCGGDLAVGALLARAARAQGLDARGARRTAALYLLSPLAIVTATRGSADSLAAAAVLASLVLLQQRRAGAAAAALGAAVHLRIYPLIYVLPCALHAALGSGGGGSGGGAAAAAARAARFCACAGAAFAALTGACLWLYGWDAVGEAYLHHGARVDTRHNFSPLWLATYLTVGVGGGVGGGGGGGGGVWAGVWAAPWSLALATALGAALWRELPLCLFLQTLAFVASNRVVTAQYFSWWLALAPLLAPRSRLPPAAAAALAAAWLAAELHWLRWAYALEMQGAPVHVELWAASLLFLAVCAAVGGAVAWWHAWAPPVAPAGGAPAAEGVPADALRAKKVA